MKKTYFFLCLFIAFTNLSFSQWTTNGTNIFNSNSGNVGIGINTPTEKLHVAGNIKFGSSTGGPASNSIEWFTSSFGSGFGHKIYSIDPGGRTDLRIAGRHNSGSWIDIMTFTSDGNVGIGETSPQFKFEVNSISRFKAPSNTNANIIIQGGVGVGTGYQAWWLTGGNGILKIGGNGATEPSTGAINIDYTGKVGIGTTSMGSFQLAVEGKIGAREVHVTLQNPWPDYVFRDKYNLLPLDQLEKYILINNHLPDMPSEQQIKESGGIELGDMNTRLLKKIEELTLYIIQLKKENETIKKDIERLKQSNK